MTFDRCTVCDTSISSSGTYSCEYCGAYLCSNCAEKIDATCPYCSAKVVR